MKRILVLAALLLSAQSAIADTYVQGYTRADGTYVPGHYRSSPNTTRSDNYGNQTQPRTQTYGLPQPSYQRDSDGDGVANQYDYDDNNNGVADDQERKRR